ncbi:MAG: hypothetical protein ABI925_12180 [Verrucomicrobiota bacterium]
MIEPTMWPELANLPKIYGTDPNHTVYLGPDVVYRTIRAEGRDSYDRVVQAQLLARAIEWGLVPTEFVSRNDRGDVLLKHARVPFVTHPGEWSPSMVREAALFILNLSSRLAEHGLMLSDSHLLNVTFRSGKPVYLDFGSINPIDNTERWIEKFRARVLVPLWLASHERKELMSDFLRSEPHGLGVRLAQTGIGRLFPRGMGKVRSIHSKRGWPAALDELRNVVDALKIKPLQSPRTKYNTRALDEKESKRKVLLEWAGETKPRSIHELAGNDATIGEMLARELGVQVLSTDFDIASVDVAHQRTSDTGLPLDVGCMNILFPLPPYGAGSCRPGAVQRLRADATLATALVHHLVGRSRTSMSSFIQIIADYTERLSIIEWVDPTDKHVLRWQEKRGIKLQPDYALENFLAACRSHFRDVQPLPKYIVETRTLYACSK